MQALKTQDHVRFCAARSGELLLAFGRNAIALNDGYSKILGKVTVHLPVAIIKVDRRYFVLDTDATLHVVRSDGSAEAALPTGLDPKELVRRSPKLLLHCGRLHFRSPHNSIAVVDTATLQRSEVSVATGELADFDIPSFERTAVFGLLRDGRVVAREADGGVSRVIEVGDSLPAYILKKMYSDHFLVGCYDEDTGLNRLHLVAGQARRSVHSVEILHDSEEFISGFALLVPRAGHEYFLFWIFESLYMFARCGQALEPLWMSAFNQRIFSNQHFSDDTWILGIGYSHMASVRIHFPERLRL